MSQIDGKPPRAGEVWHPWWELEEARSNMWGSVNRRSTWVRMAEAFTGDHVLYGYWMRRVLAEWPKSCEHNLTKPGDKRPWIGHAAVALAIGCPEDVVRAAWPLLTDEQRQAANEQAAAAIDEWRGANA